ncbi:hypothetical protein [Anaerovibrio lipolyticus]|uniref:hypothetical protein n=1 Tax=Anaerovibrio lipolyticus TaxID=82374 RepID=UPI0004818326|nr:hypothetical protein [Anaerovibrio lipolyticus]
MRIKEMMGALNKFKTSLPAEFDAVKANGPVTGTDEYNRVAKDDTTKLRDQLKALTNEASRGDEFAGIVNQVSDNVNLMVDTVQTVARQAEGITCEMQSASDALAKLAQDVQTVLRKFKF